MVEKHIGVRISAIGGDKVKAELIGIGDAGKSGMGAVGAAADNASGKVVAFGSAVGKVGQAAAAGSGNMRQTAMQLSQVAQSTMATGNFMQALAIQLPDLMLGFGAMGIAAGVAAGALLPLIGNLIEAEDPAKRLTEALKSAEKAADALTRASQAVNVPLDQAIEKWGKYADIVERSNKAEFDVARASAAKKLSEAVSALGLSEGGFNDELRLLKSYSNPEGVSQLDLTVTTLAKKFDIAEDKARQLALGLKAMTEAAKLGDGAALEASVKLQETLIAVAGGADQAAAKFGGENGLWASATDAANIAKKNVEAVHAATTKMTTGFDLAISKLTSLAGQMKQLGADGILDRIGGWVEGAGNYAAQIANSPAGMQARYIAERASGAGSQNEELVRATSALAVQLGVSAKDLLAVMSFETGGKLRPDVMGPTTKWGQHFGLIQFGQPQGRRYGVSPDSSITEQVIAAGKYLQDAGVKAGDGLANIYAAVLAGDARKVNASDLAAGGVVGNVTLATSGPQFKPHIDRAEALWSAYGGDGFSREAAQAAAEATAAEKRRNDEMARGAAIRADWLAGVQAEVQAAALEADAVGKSAREVAYLRAEFRLAQDLKSRGIELTEKLAGSEKTYGDVVRETAAKLADAAVQANQTAEGMKSAWEGLSDDLRQGLHGVLDSFADKTKSVGEAFRDMLRKMLMDVAHSGLDKALDAIFSGGGGGGGGLFGSLLGGLFGGGGGNPLGAALGGAGAPVAQAPRAGLMMADMSMMRAATKPQAANISVTLSPDLRADIVEQTRGETMQIVRVQSEADAKALPDRVAAIRNDPARRFR